MNNFSFQKGWSQVKNKDTVNVRKEIMKALNIKSKSTFYDRLKGIIEPKVSEAKAIEAIFSDHGIKEVWGE